MTSPVAAKEMKQLMDHQKELRSWINDVNRRIYELEEQYLEVKILFEIIVIIIFNYFILYRTLQMVILFEVGVSW